MVHRIAIAGMLSAVECEACMKQGNEWMSE